jgi:hypothetical protein
VRDEDSGPEVSGCAFMLAVVAAGVVLVFVMALCQR